MLVGANGGWIARVRRNLFGQPMSWGYRTATKVFLHGYQLWIVRALENFADFYGFDVAHALVPIVAQAPSTVSTLPMRSFQLSPKRRV